MKKITLDYIAKELNTSKNTVSKALRGKPGVSRELRDKILYMADETGYFRQNMDSKTKHNINITLICKKSFFDEPTFWSQVFYGIWECAEKNEVSIRTITVDNMPYSSTSSSPQLLNPSCNGYIVVGTVSDTLLAQIASLNIPIVVVDHYCPGIDCDYINSANEAGIYKAINYLVGHNHQKIGFINNSESAYSFTERHEAFMSYTKKRGISTDPRFIWLDAVYLDTCYYKNKINLLKNDPDFPKAWICVNDSTALAFYNALMQLGFKVPGDISIIGFDNISNTSIPSLTTIEVPQRAMGRRAILQLLNRLQHPGEPFESIQLNTTLVERGSVKQNIYM